MAQVPQSTLRYLFYDVLRVQPYRDPNRTYSDVVSTLQRYPSITLKGTKEYIFENGTPTLLAYLSGVLPVSFRGTIYHFPILIYVPYTYPYDAPILYVNPSDEIAVNPGQHVAGDGKVYHHYLAHWRETWERSNIVDFLAILAEVFAKEPPVRSKQQQRVQQDPRAPPRPPLPHGQAGRSQGQSLNGGPPPPPPKESANGSVMSLPPKPSRYDAPPPLPSQNSPRPTSVYQQQPTHQRPASQYQQQRSSSLRPAPPGQSQPQNWQQSTQSWQQPPAAQQQLHQRPPPPVQYQDPRLHPRRLDAEASQPQAFRIGPEQPSPAPQPQPSLLDSPFDRPLPTGKPASNMPAPPIPPNPQKDALLSHLSSLLASNLQTSQTTAQTQQLPLLTSQNSALTTALSTLQSELHALSTLQTSLKSNISALTTSLSAAGSSIQHASQLRKENKLPDVDAMLIPPNIVSQQLYTAVSEERGIEAAMRGLQEGFVQGRVGGEVWGRRMRELAREGFRRKWLVRRVGRGWGLEGA